MNVEEIASLLAYNRWANERLLALAARAPLDRQHERHGGGADSLHRTFVHLLSAEVTWLRRCQEKPPLPALDPSDFRDLSAIRARWDAHNRAVAEFLAELSASRLATRVQYVNAAGETWEYPVWQMLIHVVNHGTHHRSEVADMLTRIGYSPPALDMLVFCDEQSASAGGTV